VPDQGLLDLPHQRADLQRIGTDQQRAQVVMNAAGVCLRRAGEHRPRRRLAESRDARIRRDLDDGTGHRFLDVAHTVPPLHLQRPAHDVDRNPRDAKLAHLSPEPVAAELYLGQAGV
jgi:hypothetical protein